MTSDELYEDLDKLNHETKELSSKIREVENKIKKFSQYDFIMIGKVLSRLMTVYEGVLYSCFRCDVSGYYTITLKNNVDDILHPSLTLKPLDEDIKYMTYSTLCGGEVNKDNIFCYLFPSKFSKITISITTSQEYIQKFIDYLFEDRVQKNVTEVDCDYLNNVLDDFLSLTKKEQLLRQKAILERKKERQELDKKCRFEASCFVDRKAMFDNICYIINNYEENINSYQDIEEERNGNTLSGYHKLIIKSGEYEIIFKTFVDKDEDDLESYYYASVNISKDTNINFFDIKRQFNSIIKESNVLKKYFDMIEDYFNIQTNDENRVLNSTDLNAVLLLIDRFNKGKQKRLGMKKQF